MNRGGKILFLKPNQKKMKSKKQVEERIEELQGILIKNQKDLREGILNSDTDKALHALTMIKVLEQKIEVLKWTLS